MPKRQPTRRASLIGGSVAAEIDELKPGLGTALITEINQRLTAVNTRMTSQAGDRGTVAIAKQPGATGVGLHLNSQRLAGVAIPRDGSDAINLDYLRRFFTCDFFAQMFDDCVELEEVRAVDTGVSIGQFPPHGNQIFVNTSETFAYYATSPLGGAFEHDEMTGQVGVIDVSNRHAPFRTGRLILARHAGPIGMGFDPARKIVFACFIQPDGPGPPESTHQFTAVDCSVPSAPTLVGQTHHTDDYPVATHVCIGNKSASSDVTFGYYTTQLTENNPTSPPITIHPNVVFFLKGWNFTNPAGMFEASSLRLGGYHIAEDAPDLLGIGVDGWHYRLAMDRRGTGSLAANISIGDQNLNFGGPVTAYLNLWHCVEASTLLSRFQLGTYGFQANALIQNVPTVRVWGTNVFVLAEMSDGIRHLFAFDCSSNTPVLKTDMAGTPCGEISAMDVRGDCLCLHAGFDDVVFDISDLSDFRLIGGCHGVVTGDYFYQDNLFQLTRFAIPSDLGDRFSVRIGLTINNLDEHGITCG